MTNRKELPPELEERNDQIIALAWFLAIGATLFVAIVFYNIFT